MTSRSTEELRRWCLANTKRGSGAYLRDHTREMSIKALLRLIGLHPGNFYHWLHKKDTLPARCARLLDRFIDDWEAGTVAFTPFRGTKRRELVRVEKPVRRVRLAVPFDGSAPRLKFMERRTPAPRMPTFSELIRPNARNLRLLKS